MVPLKRLAGVWIDQPDVSKVPVYIPTLYRYNEHERLGAESQNESVSILNATDNIVIPSIKDIGKSQDVGAAGLGHVGNLQRF